MSHFQNTRTVGCIEVGRTSDVSLTMSLSLTKKRGGKLSVIILYGNNVLEQYLIRLLSTAICLKSAKEILEFWPFWVNDKWGFHSKYKVGNIGGSWEGGVKRSLLCLRLSITAHEGNKSEDSWLSLGRGLSTLLTLSTTRVPARSFLTVSVL